MKPDYFINYWGREYPVFSVHDKIRGRDIECSLTTLSEKLFSPDSPKEPKDNAASCILQQMSAFVTPEQFDAMTRDELAEIVMEELYG